VSGLGALALICQTSIVVEQCIRVGSIGRRVRCLTEEGGVGNEVDVLRAICRRTGIADQKRDSGSVHIGAGLA
jgi:hypothetical protein